MGFLKNLFSRSRSTAGEKIGPSFPTKSTDSVPVPPGHEVTTYHHGVDSYFRRTKGGVFIVELGTSSDEFQEEFRRLADEVDRAFAVAGTPVGEPAPPVLLYTEPGRLSDLFAPHDLRVNPLTGLLVWVLDAGSAEFWLREPNVLLAGLRRARTYQLNGGPIVQVVMLAVRECLVMTGGKPRIGVISRPEPPSGTWELAERLSGLGVTVSAIPDDGLFFFEVCRPDAVVCALRREPVPRAGTSETQEAEPNTPSFVARAPRLRRLILAALESRAGAVRLFEELLSRKFALLVMFDSRKRVPVMSRPGFDEALPVYPDLTALLQMGCRRGLNPDSINYHNFLPRDLFKWADGQSFGGLALNVSVDPKQPKYFMIDAVDLHALACSRLPENRETVQ